MQATNEMKRNAGGGKGKKGGTEERERRGERAEVLVKDNGGAGIQRR